MPDENFEEFGLRTLEDISELILHSHDLRETVQNIANLVAKRMATDVCSIYLLEADGETLTLYATKGLSKSSIGKVRMNTSEGLTGLVVEQRGVVAIEDAPEHPRYKYFRGTKEERFHSFLGLPLFEHKSPSGVIVVQTRQPRTFTTREIRTLSTIANQLSSIIITARLLDSVQKKEEERAFFEKELQRLQTRNSEDVSASAPAHGTVSQQRMIRGIAVSPGFTWGKVLIINHHLTENRQTIDRIGTRQEEKKRFIIAVEKAKIQTIYLEKKVAQTLSQEDAAIFHTHLLILEDRSFANKIQDLIDQNLGAVRAVEEVVSSYVTAFSRMDDPYLRERSADMKDIGRRLLDCLTGNDRQPRKLRDKRILLAKEILPSDLATIDPDKILGLLSGSGDINSHASIMAKSLGIPAIIAPWQEVRDITQKDTVIIDGNTGCFYINPDEKVRKEYERLQNDLSIRKQELASLRDEPAVTLDGFPVHLRANIALLSDIKVALANGAEGVGLYRSEFPYMARNAFPNRHELYRLYRKVMEDFSPLPVTIRTLDIGGDKRLPYFSHPHEENPFMGWRAIRLTLETPEILREQLAGILMASSYGTTRIMFPLISSIEEIRQVREMLQQVTSEVTAAGHKVATDVKIGIMVEVPAAVQLARFLINEVDFFSIGTNDLIQYTLAADRNNSRVQRYYDPYHPAVLHSINHVATVAAAAGKPVSLCGEMAADPLNAILLMGLGITEFSLSAPYIPQIKQSIRAISMTQAQSFATTVLGLATAAEIRKEIDLSRRQFGL